MYPKQLTLVVLLFTCVSMLCNAQKTVDTLYYTDYTFYKQKNKSKFAKILIKDGDFESEQQMNLKTGQVYVYKAYRGDEPVGVWKRFTSIQGVDEKNYNFDVVYTNQMCKGIEGKSPLRALLFDIDQINYQAPKISVKGEQKAFPIVFKRNFVTPRIIRAKSLQGGYMIDVDVIFKIDKNGNIKNIRMYKGQNPLIDKEVVRTLQTLQFDQPATKNGQPIEMDFLYKLKMQVRPNAL